MNDPSLNQPNETPGTPKVNILIVDDLPEKLLVFETILEDLQENLVSVHSGREALQQILQQDFAVILLDVNMPDIDGFETATLIRQYHKTKKTPIIFITSYIDDIQTARGYALGAVDYIAAPVVPEILRSKVQVFVDLRRMHMQLQQQAQEREALARAEAARTAAEAATLRADLLAEASHTLSRSLDTDATAAELLQFVTRVAADTAVIVFADMNDDIRCALLAQRRPHYEQTTLTELPGALRDIIFSRTSAELEPIFANTATEVLLTTDTASTIALTAHHIAIFPIANGPRFRGALALLDLDRQDFFPADPALIREVVSRAAIALENALLYRAILEGDRRKGEFLAMLAHELRNPLAPIRNAVAIMQHPGKGAQYVEWAGDVIARQVGHMARLMDDLLDVSRIGQGKLVLDLKTIFVADFIRYSVEAVQPLIAERGHTLDVEVPEFPIAVQGDTVRLAQIVSNLLHNAAKYSPRGSAIQLRATFADDTTANEEMVRIAVSDNGEGIAPELLPNIFDMFTQGERAIDRVHGGLGVGLTLVKNLIELHGGHVEARSDGPQRGAEFAVYLPARRVFAVDDTKIADAPHAPAGSERQRVLVIDDLVESAESMAQLLRVKGFEVDVAFDGSSGLERAATFAPAVILLDIGMPGMDGYEVARRLRAAATEPRPLLIALTGYGAEEDLQRAQAAGFDAHFVKPADVDKLLTTINAHCIQRASPAVVSSTG
jgi:signal transduction histidine kinase/CheY-like chemotaxis protein